MANTNFLPSGYNMKYKISIVEFEPYTDYNPYAVKAAEAKGETYLGEPRVRELTIYEQQFPELNIAGIVVFLNMNASK